MSKDNAQLAKMIWSCVAVLAISIFKVSLLIDEERHKQK